MRIGKLTSAVFIFWLSFISGISHADQTVHIAVVSPYEEASSGTNGVELYLNQIQGITHNGIRIQVDRYVDGNNKDQAVAVARQIVRDGRAIAVIGHNYSSTSTAAGQIYQQARIPAISFSATNPNVTKNNPWYFRTIFNDASQGEFLAYYAAKTLNQDRLTIIAESNSYGAFLGKVFKEQALRNGVEQIESYTLDMTSDLPKQYEAIAEAVAKRGEKAGLIFLSLQDRQGIEVIRALKDLGVQNPLMGPDSLYSSTLFNGFDNFPMEKMYPGHYSNGLYITAPIVFDVANAAAQDMRKLYREKYRDNPDWTAAYGYDTAKVIVTAIAESQSAFADESDAPVEQRRGALLNTLQNINSPKTAVSGVTGLNYFDEKGDAIKPMFIAVLHDKTAVSGLEQYGDIPDASKIIDLTHQLQSGHIVQVGERYMYKKSVIFTGVKLHHIRRIDDQSNTSELDFTLWFRYRGAFDPSQIKFSNAVDELSLNSPYIKTQANNIYYQAFRVKGVFRNNFIDDIERREQIKIGFSLRNLEMDRNSHLYAADVMGLGLTGNKHLTDEVKEQLLTDDLDGWQVSNAQMFERSVNVDSLGVPQYINITDASVPYSQFHFVIDLKKTGLRLADALPETHSKLLTLIGIGLFLAIYFSRYIWTKAIRARILLARIRWGLLGLSSALILSASETWLSLSLFPTLEVHVQRWILHIYDLLWWIIPAILLVRAAEVFIWQTLQLKTGRPVPGIIKNMVAFIIYTLALFAIVAFVYNQKLTGLLATSGMLAMIVGLAVQMNLSNIFSGIALNLEHPFRVGDWVRIGEHEGQVIDVNWRATRLLTRVKHEISIPNTPVADSPIINYSSNDGETRQILKIGVHPAHDVAQVKALLISAAYKHPNVVTNPPPQCPFAGVEDGIAQYKLIFSYTDYALTMQVVDQVWSQIIANFQSAGINYLPPMQRIELHKAFLGPHMDMTDTRNFGKHELFSGLPEAFSKDLESLVEEKEFEAGEYLVRSGAQNHSLYILRTGVVAVMEENKDGQWLEVQRLGHHDPVNTEILSDNDFAKTEVKAVVKTNVWEVTPSALSALFKMHPESFATFSQLMKAAAQQAEQRRAKTSAIAEVKLKDRFAWLD
ncbi:ABC transporter substrate-binding protein [Oceanospirillum sanctuarii]|uniref:ABC transporter substrate-binding protein n=1 Tax=Oceanospirillum sanctuarii TaxID=1434821 RepID=UPI000A38EAD1|nr:ABC transporter substrate-binding protein [Oceanospirillum sanctuarii]